MLDCWIHLSPQTVVFMCMYNLNEGPYQRKNRAVSYQSYCRERQSPSLPVWWRRGCYQRCEGLWRKLADLWTASGPHTLPPPTRCLSHSIELKRNKRHTHIWINTQQDIPRYVDATHKMRFVDFLIEFFFWSEPWCNIQHED